MLAGSDTGVEAPLFPLDLARRFLVGTLVVLRVDVAPLPAVVLATKIGELLQCQILGHFVNNLTLNTDLQVLITITYVLQLPPLLEERFEHWQ